VAPLLDLYPDFPALGAWYLVSAALLDPLLAAELNDDLPALGLVTTALVPDELV